MSSKQQEVQKLLQTRSERVKMIDMHPKEPLVLCSLYSGQVTMWNYDTKTMVKSFEVTDQPLRCVKFITRMQCFACGADDMQIRIYNYNTMEKVKTFQAHDDYIRCIAVHDTLPYLLTASDDMTIKLWDWSKGWANTLLFEGHMHYVMQVTFNPKDAMTFATASLDATVKVWNVTTPVPNFTLEGHEDGVNCVEYYQGGDKPYLISGSDDQTVKIWDYQTKACIQTLSHHAATVNCVYFHPDVPLLFTGSEDEQVGIINTQTWRNEQIVNYGLGRGWTVCGRPNTNRVALGFDRGMVVLKVGKDEPVMSMDAKGKILCSSGNDVIQIQAKGLGEVQDGEPVTVATKELGICESAPQSIVHGPSGQYIAVVTDGEYTINSALAFKSKMSGNATAFAWGAENGSYAILENSVTLKTFKSFKEKDSFRLPASADALFPGPLLGARVDGSLILYDWETFNVIRRIDEEPKLVEWSDSGELMVLVTESSMYVLKYNADDVAEHFASGNGSTEDGLDFAFDLVETVEERARRVLWIGDCLVFVSGTDHLSYYIGGEVTEVATLNKGTHVLGFLPKENRLVCIDKDRNVMSYLLHVSVIQYKTAICREDFETATAFLPEIPESMLYKVAQFLQARGHLDMALEVTPEAEHRFDLAVQLGKLSVIHQIAKEDPSVARWKQVGDIALQQAHFELAEDALTKAGDYNGLLLIYSCTGNNAAVATLGQSALAKGKANIAFTCFHTVGQYEQCLDILLATGKVAEAAFYARTYVHSRIEEVVKKWRLQAAGQPRLREALADPVGYPNLFPNVNFAAPAAAVEEPAVAEEEPAQEEVAPPSPPKAAAPEPEPVHVDPVPEPAAPSEPVVEEPPAPAPPVEEAVEEEPVEEEEPAPAPSAPAPAAPAAAANDDLDEMFGDDGDWNDGAAAAPAQPAAAAPAEAAPADDADEFDDEEWN